MLKMSNVFFMVEKYEIVFFTIEFLPAKFWVCWITNWNKFFIFYSWNIH